MVYKLGFDYTNNMEKYEALILDLKASLILKIKNLEIYDGSQLVINQVNDVYVIKDKNLQSYKLVSHSY